MTHRMDTARWVPGLRNSTITAHRVPCVPAYVSVDDVTLGRFRWSMSVCRCQTSCLAKAAASKSHSCGACARCDGVALTVCPAMAQCDRADDAVLAVSRTALRWWWRFPIGFFSALVAVIVCAWQPWARPHPPLHAGHWLGRAGHDRHPQADRLPCCIWPRAVRSQSLLRAVAVVVDSYSNE